MSDNDAGPTVRRQCLGWPLAQQKLVGFELTRHATMVEPPCSRALLPVVRPGAATFRARDSSYRLQTQTHPWTPRRQRNGRILSKSSDIQSVGLHTCEIGNRAKRVQIKPRDGHVVLVNDAENSARVVARQKCRCSDQTVLVSHRSSARKECLKGLSPRLARVWRPSKHQSA